MRNYDINCDMVGFKMIPKFRAWHKELKQMFRVYRLAFGTEGAMMPDLAKEPAGTGILPCSMEEIELMQWAGVQDKNGKDIYEGDILECSVEISRSFKYEGSFEKEYDITGFVALGRAVWVINAITGNETINEDWKWDYCELYNCDNIKIIGNIYENPELLKDLK